MLNGGKQRGHERRAIHDPDGIRRSLHRGELSGASARPSRPGWPSRRAARWSPAPTDLAWTRITLWRGLLAAALDQPPYEQVTSATVSGGSDSPSTDLLAGWLAQTLKCPVTRAAPGRAPAW